ncbi:MAG TPA: 3-isopropylmalate dehydrogenase [Blattabacteriaceae bacterium]
MEKNIAVLAGDGIGPEVIKQARKVLNAIEKKFGHTFKYLEGFVGASAIDETGDPLPTATLDICSKSDAIIFGTIGNPKYDDNPKAKVRPEEGLLRLRKIMGLYCNIRPIKVYPSMPPLRKIQTYGNIDFVIYRELTSGIYFGKKGRSIDGHVAYDHCVYSVREIERIGRAAFEAGLKRRKKLTLIDKANVLETSRLWRETIKKMSKNYRQIQLDFLFIDNAAMQLIINPERFDVILTENMFGDILSDEASLIGGSIGLLPSASIGEKVSLFEPIHGSYPQAAGKNIANPIASILSVAMMLDHFGLFKEGKEIYKSVKYSIDKKMVTKDIEASSPLGTEEVGDFITECILQN